MPETQLTIVRDDSPELLRVRKHADSLSPDLKDMADMKPSLLTMREGAKLLDRVNAYIEFVHGALDPGIKEAHEVWKQRTALRSILLRIPLDNAFGPRFRGIVEAGAIEKQLVLIPKRAIADSKSLIEQKKAEERRQLEDAQRKAQEAERAKEMEHIEAQRLEAQRKAQEIADEIQRLAASNRTAPAALTASLEHAQEDQKAAGEAAEDLAAAPLPPVAIPVAAPVMPDVSTTLRYLVEGIEVANLNKFVQWLSAQPAPLIEKLIEVRKGGIAAYLNATAGAEIPGIKASKSAVVIDRRK